MVGGGGGLNDQFHHQRREHTKNKKKETTKKTKTKVEMIPLRKKMGDKQALRKGRRGGSKTQSV